MENNKLIMFDNIKIIKKIRKGRVNDCYECFDDVNKRKVFIKINISNNSSLIQNIELQNNKLFFENKINVPTIYEIKEFENKSVLIMEYLDFSENKFTTINEINKIVSAIKNIHSNKSLYYGMDYQWTNGKLTLPSTKSNNWLIFFKEYRWKPLIDHLYSLVSNNIKLMDIWVKGMKIYDIMHNILIHNPVPTLLHGDLNNENYGIVDNKVYFLICNVSMAIR